MSIEAGILYVVATPIGNRDDITLRAIEVLRGVDRIVAEDTRHSGPLLRHLGISKPMLTLHDHNEETAARQLVERLRAGESLALISDAGTPLISDPGYSLVRACRDQGLSVVPVPGANAAIAALSVAGLPTDRFRFEGFMPRRQAARVARLRDLLDERATLVFYESSHRVLESLRDLVDVFGADRDATMARELTKLHETVDTRTLGELLERVSDDADQRRGELVILVAGATPSTTGVGDEGERVLAILLDELPVKQAAGIAARITGIKKNALYRRALELADEG